MWWCRIATRSAGTMFAPMSKETIREASSAFESSMKAVCDIMGWSIRPTLANGLIPAYQQTQFSSLRARAI